MVPVARRRRYGLPVSVREVSLSRTTLSGRLQKAPEPPRREAPPLGPGVGPRPPPLPEGSHRILEAESDIRACLSYAEELLREEHVYPLASA